MRHRKRRRMQVNATAVPAGCWNAVVAHFAQVVQVAQADPLVCTHLVAEEFHVPTGAKEPLRLMAASSLGRPKRRAPPLPALHALLPPLQGQDHLKGLKSEIRDMHNTLPTPKSREANKSSKMIFYRGTLCGLSYFAKILTI